VTKKKKTYFNWSSGKDASMALNLLNKDDQYEVDLLLTSINSHHDRVSMHGLKRELLEKQAEEIGLNLKTIELPEEPTMEEYNKELSKTVEYLKSEGYSHSGFGDIFLEDLRKYREEQLKAHQIECVFPLWKKDTQSLIHDFIDSGFRAAIVAMNANLLDESFLGREINQEFLDDLPKNVDPCGENGEFHTFCYDGPIFKNSIKFELGERVFREYKKPKNDEETCSGNESMGFWFIDLILK
jgi:uncharacterized protein (TIGR00290 family)